MSIIRSYDAATLAAAYTSLNKKPPPWPVRPELTKYPELWNDLLCYLPFWEIIPRDVVTGKALVKLNGAPEVVMTPAGLRAKISASIDFSDSEAFMLDSSAVADAIIADRDEITILLGISTTSGDTRGIFGDRASGTGRLSIENQGYGALSFAFGDTLIQSSFEGYTPGDDLIICRAGPIIGQEIHLNGEQHVHSAAAPTKTTAFYDYLLGATANRAGNDPWFPSRPSEWSAFGLWSRELTNSETAILSKDRYAPIRPDPAKVIPYIKSTGGGPGTITGSGGIDLISLVLSGAGKFIHTGSGSISLNALLFAGTGSLGTAITGSGSIELDSLIFAGNGKFVLSGSGSLTLDELSLLGSGVRAVQGAGNIELAELLFAGTTNRIISGTGQLQLDQFIISGSGLRITTVTGSGGIILTALSLVGVGSKPVLIAPKTAADVIKQAPDRDQFPPEFVRWLEQNFSTLQQIMINGADGSFTTADGKTVTVTNGIIIDIT